MLRVALVCGMVLFSSVAWGAGMPKGMTFYVSPSGNDAWSGRKASPTKAGTDGPFATVARAREAVRGLDLATRMAEPIKVVLRGGTYELTEPLTFGPEDSGTPEHPVIYQAYRGEQPVISGGRAITGWQRGEGEVWVAKVPAEWPFRQLFVNGRRATRARTPNEGFFSVEGEVSLDPQAAFTFREGDVRAEWANSGAEAIVLQAWAEIRSPIVAVDTAAKKVTLAGQCARSNRETNARYWIENAPEALDSPGEWYRGNGEVRYWPRADEDMTKAEVVAPALLQLVRMEGEGDKPVHEVRFVGITFAHTDWTMGPTGYTDMQAAYDIPAAFEANGAASIQIEQCSFRHLGGYAITFGRACRGCAVTKSELTDLGAGGVKVGRPELPESPAEETKGNTISDNHIHDLGIVYPAGIGIWVGQSGGNTLSHNHLHDTNYSAMSVGWTWGYGPTAAQGNIIEYNHAHDIGRGVLSDLGAIYTLGMQPGTVIRHNLFHDLRSHTYGGWGIYLDEGSTHVLVENNIVYNTKSGGFHQHYGRENTIRNNVFAFAEEGQLIRTRDEPHLSFTLEHNIVYWRRGELLGSNWSGDNYRLDSNLYWNAAGAAVTFDGSTLAEWQAKGQDQHSLIADPLFVDPEHGDFALKPGSPAAKVGFKAIDVKGVGPRGRD